MTSSTMDLLRAKYALSGRFKEELENWLLEEGARAPTAARGLARIGVAMMRQLGVETDRLGDELRSGRPVDLVSIVGLNSRVRMVELLRELMENSTFASLHHVLSPTVRHELGGLGVAGSVLVSGTRDVSYELLPLKREFFEQLVGEPVLDEVDWPLWVFRVPHRPLDWPLHHVLLYHEIGHAAYPGMTITAPSELDPDRTEELFKRMQLADLRTAYLKWMASWVEELFADALGVLLAGPAYVLAFSRFLGGNFRIETASTTHPPLCLRLELIAAIAKTCGYRAAIGDPGDQLIQEWEDLATSRRANVLAREADLKRLLPLMMREVHALHPSILGLAVSVAGPRVYASDSVLDDRERGRLMLEYNVPPIEECTAEPSPQALSAARIFGTCWAAYLQAFNKCQDAEGLAEISRGVAEVLLGSLDGADAIRSWNRTR